MFGHSSIGTIRATGKTLWLGGTALAGLALAAAPASAQQTPVTSPDTVQSGQGASVPTTSTNPNAGLAPGSEVAPANANAPAASTTADTAPAAAIGDIVVTANRTQSLASKTPIALTAIGGSALRAAGVANTVDLAAQVPNLSIDRTGGLQITIRGVTSTDSTEKGDPSAAFLLDGVYIARTQAQEVSFFDIDRVEVLRGPQGTLYGRNTTAGVVNLISNKPSNKFEAAVNAGFGNFGTYQADAMVNVPVTDTLAIRAAGAYERRDNYITSGVTNPYSYNPFKNNLSGRLQALWHINDDMTLLLKGDYSDIKGNTAYFSRAEYAYDLSNPFAPRYLNADEKTIRTLQFAYPGPSSTHNKTWGISGEYNWNFGPMTMTYLGSYRKFDRNENFVADFGGLIAAGPFNGNYKQNSQELRFASNDWGKLKVQFGGYYFKETSYTALYLLGLQALVGKPYYGFPENTTSESYAGFGQATYSITSNLHLTGGVRYSHDRKERHGGTVFQNGPTFNAATDTLLLNYADRDFSKVTWRAGVDWDVNNRTLLYGSVATGYKAGGFNDGCLAGTSYGGFACNQPTLPQTLYFQPETLTSYEAGFKMHTADNTFRLNGSAFYYDYKNLQLSQTAVCTGGGPCQVTQNAAKAKVEGVELESTVAPSPRNRFDITFTWLHAVYRQYQPVAGIDFSGRPLDRSPTFVTSVGYTYTLPLANDGTITASARTRLSDSYVLTNYSIPAQFRQPSYTRTDLTLGYNAPHQRWYVQGFAHNLENKVQITSIDGSDNITISDPRTYGVRAGFKF